MDPQPHMLICVLKKIHNFPCGGNDSNGDNDKVVDAIPALKCFLCNILLNSSNF